LPLYYPCRAISLEKSGIAVLLSSICRVVAVFGAVWAAAMHGALYLLNQAGDGTFPSPDFLGLARMGGVICMLTMVFYYIYLSRVRAREAERTEQELRIMARDAELRALRAQLNPHFLFNSLNSISALTTANPKGAREMCVLLSDFLRKSLRLGERLTVPLVEELDLLKNYFAIEQIRFAPRLRVEWQIDERCKAAEVPALLLQPLAENAIKHGISQLIEGGTVRIAAQARDGYVSILLENPVDPDRETPKGLGLGVRQVNQRLATHFGQESRMEIDDKDSLHCVRLYFPLLSVSEKEASDD
jgi:LytS/YehU family sensor histidine kinase